MGMVRIELRGSFGNNEHLESAMQNGHAAAVARAIQWLSEEVLPAAIRSDHDLHEQGCRPNGPFGHDDAPSPGHIPGGDSEHG